jgi:hypothetical protein
MLLVLQSQALFFVCYELIHFLTKKDRKSLERIIKLGHKLISDSVLEGESIKNKKTKYIAASKLAQKVKLELDKRKVYWAPLTPSELLRWSK